PILFRRAGSGILRFGANVWADAFSNELLVVAQVFRSDGPHLVLMRAPFSTSAVDLGDSASWTILDLDAGGWDFDARREGDRLVGFRFVRSEKILLMKSGGGWSGARLFHFVTPFPHHLERFATIQELFSVLAIRDTPFRLRLGLATFLPTNPVALFKFEPSAK